MTKEFIGLAAEPECTPFKEVTLPVQNVSLSLLQQLAKGYVLHGQGQTAMVFAIIQTLKWRSQT
jgi:hypothetical protein